MRGKSKRLFAIIAAFAMLLSLLPVTAGAVLNGVPLDYYDVDFTVNDEDGDPLDGAAVKLNNITRTTDADGLAAFTDVAAGTYDWEVSKAGYHSETGEIVVDDDKEVSVELEEIVPVTDYSTAASRITGYDDAADPGEGAEIELQFRFADISAVDDYVQFYVESSRDAEFLYLDADLTEEVPKLDDRDSTWKVVARTSSTGYVSVWVDSRVPGDANFKVGRGEVGGIVTGQLSGSPVTITFEEFDLGSIVMAGDKEVKAGTRYRVSATVRDTNEQLVEGVDVTFYESVYADRRYREIGTAKADEDGVAALERSKTAAGTFYYLAAAGTIDYDDDEVAGPQEVTVVAAEPFSISAAKDDYYVEYETEAEVVFNMEDRFGNALTASLAQMRGEDVTVTDPDGAVLDADTGFSLGYDEEDFIVAFDAAEYGTYTVEAFIRGTGLSATARVHVADFGEVVGVEIEIDPDVYSTADEDMYFDDAIQVTLTGETGIQKSYGYGALEDAGIILSSDSLTVVRVSREGGLRIGSDAGLAVITAIHEPSGLEASADVTVSGEPAALQVAWDYELGELEGTVTLTYYDADGLKALEAPDNAGYSVITPAGVEVVDQEDFAGGEATFSLEAEAYGSYTIRVVTDLGISTTFQADFLPPFDKGAAEVIMYIGSTTILVDGVAREIDVAPFIEEDRTFVPVRFLAEAFAAEADWGPKDARTEWVSLTRADVTIEISIGEDEMTVTRGDDEEVVVLDAPARIVEGRTFLPFRAIGEAFGAAVDFETDEETGLTTSVWFTQP